MRVASVTTTVLLTICLMMSNACGADGEGGAQTPAQGEQIVIRGQATFQPEERMFYGGLGDTCEVTGQVFPRAGAQVVVKDATGTTIATGALEPGIIVEGVLGLPRPCRFAFAIEGVPRSDFYTIEVSDSGGAVKSLSYDELESHNWTVEFGVWH